MNETTIITHFSEPNWQIVNKLSAISKCLDVKLLHCSSFEKLKKTVKQPFTGKVLFFTDEGMIDFVAELDASSFRSRFEAAMFIFSPISAMAHKISNLRIVKYLIGVQSVESYGRDLAILIKKFSQDDILNLEKYLAFGCKVNERVVSSGKSKRDALEAINNYILRLGDPGYLHPFREYARVVSELTDELLLNAIFNANPKMHGVDRSQPFNLHSREEVRVEWGYDGEYFGVSVRDPFGKFSSNTIMSYLATQKRMGELLVSPSAGLGLKFIFERAHQVIANVKQEQVTEVMVLVKFVNRMRDFEQEKKSFYYFGDESSKSGNKNEEKNENKATYAKG